MTMRLITLVHPSREFDVHEAVLRSCSPVIDGWLQDGEGTRLPVDDFTTDQIEV